MSRGLQIFGRVLWIIPAIAGFGFLTWASFIYPGIRMKRKQPIWLWLVAVFSALSVVLLISLASIPTTDFAAAFLIFVWLGGIATFCVMLRWWIPFQPETVVRRSASATSEPIASSVWSEGSAVSASQASDANQASVIDRRSAPQPPTGQSESATVFVSHASQDRVSAERLAAKLEEQGITTWLSHRDVGVGGNYAEEVVHAIVDANFLLIILTEAAIQSPHVRREVTVAIDKGISLLPVNMSLSDDFMWTLPVDWTYWLSLAQVLRQSNEHEAAIELAHRIRRA